MLKAEEEVGELHVEAESDFRRQSVEQQHEDNPLKKTLLVCRRWKENLRCTVLQVNSSNSTALKLIFKSLRAFKDRRGLLPREERNRLFSSRNHSCFPSGYKGWSQFMRTQCEDHAFFFHFFHFHFKFSIWLLFTIQQDSSAYKYMYTNTIWINLAVLWHL